MLTTSIQAGDVLVEKGGITILILHIEELPEPEKSILGTHHVWWMGLKGFTHDDWAFKVTGPWQCGPRISWRRKE